jgi:hypothetical protein
MTRREIVPSDQIGCPHCGHIDGWTQYDYGFWFICNRHHVRWEVFWEETGEPPRDWDGPYARFELYTEAKGRPVVIGVCSEEPSELIRRHRKARENDAADREAKRAAEDARRAAEIKRIAEIVEAMAHTARSHPNAPSKGLDIKLTIRGQTFSISNDDVMTVEDDDIPF